MRLFVKCHKLTAFSSAGWRTGGKTLCKTVFTLDSCTSIPGAVVCCFKTEKEMLRRWKELLTATDPDIITGYNCINFDLNYLLVRATTLKLDNFHYLCKTRIF